MLNIDLEQLLYTVQIDFQTEITKIVGQVFSNTEGSIQFWQIYHLWENIKGNDPVRCLRRA